MRVGIGSRDRRVHREIGFVDGDKEEGGLWYDSKDPGGMKNLGITVPTLTTWEKHPADASDIRGLTKDHVELIHRGLFWSAVHGDALPKGFDLTMFHFAVNSGVGLAERTLQTIVGVKFDGAMGPDTLAALGASQVPSPIQSV